ncbi:MAG: hypothetical protein DLM58_09710 [Pseudonocardiales bacterium]|nr:MAG: hypothetical protein DLM58_09710 [Pseudonocardiales bacterium]
MLGTVATHAPTRRLVARRLYRVIAGVVLAAVAVAAGLGLDYRAGSWPQRVDSAVDPRLVAQFGGRLGLVHELADLGGAAPILLITSALVIVTLGLGRGRGTVLAVLAPSAAVLITEGILKPLIGRIQLGQAYPSGHATGFCAVAFVVVLLALDQRPRRLSRPVQVIVCGAALGLMAGVCVALVAAQYHVATDVIGGVCVALVTVLTLAMVIDRVADQRSGLTHR